MIRAFDVPKDIVVCDDAPEFMGRLPDSCIDLTVTSPPYDKMRKYDGFDLRFEPSAEQLFRITKPGGVVVWVVGDSTVNGSESGTSFKQALYFMEVGFKLHDTMIFHKINPIPQNHNRYEQSFEYMFVFSKGRPVTFNPLTEPTKNFGKKFDWGNRKTVMDENQCRRDRATDVIEVKSRKIRQNIFSYSVGGGHTGHPAVFPEKLAEEQIITWSNPGDMVLDPFIGSGTTAKMAKVNGRHYLGCDISAEYVEMARKRIAEC